MRKNKPNKNLKKEISTNHKKHREISYSRRDSGGKNCHSKNQDQKKYQRKNRQEVYGDDKFYMKEHINEKDQRFKKNFIMF